MRLVAFILFTFNLLLGYSQGNPDWVSEEYRKNYYPQASYITGYGEQWDISKKNAESTMNHLANLAKSDLIESVKVSIKSVSTSQLADYNGEITDFFKNKTESSSELNIVGLRTEKFYDKKNKKAFAFVYANKSEVARYYSDVIMKSRSKIEQGIAQSKELRNSDLINSFNSLSDKMHLFGVIEDAQTVLLALGANTSIFLQKQEVNILKTDFFKEVTSVKKDSQITIQILSSFMCKEIIQKANVQNTLTVSEFSFEETGMTSEFSHQLKSASEQTFIQTSKYTPADDGNFRLEGTYWLNDTYVELKARLRDVKNKKTIAFSNTYILRSALEKNHSNYIPKDIEKLKMLPHLEFVKLNDNLKGKAGFGISTELKVKVKYKGVARENVPVVFYNNNDEVVYCENVLSDKYGIARCKVNTISGKYKNQLIKASVDLNNFVSISEGNEYFKKTMGNKEIPFTSIRVMVVPSTVSVEASEYRFGIRSNVKLVEPEIKEVLSGAGFKFVTNQNSADYVIHIRATSRKGANLDGLHFAFVDVTISVYSNSEGKEIFKDSLVNFKGAGGSFDQAASKAFYKAAENAKNKIEEVLLK